MKRNVFVVIFLLGVIGFLAYDLEEFAKRQSLGVSAHMPPVKFQLPLKEAKGGKPFTLPFKKGEKVTYDIRTLAIKAGEATLTFEGVEELSGQSVYVIAFRADAMNFLDEEKIYADTANFYPLRVERNLNIFGKKEKITEDYDQQKGQIKVTKYAGSRSSEQLISKQGPIDNIYCFIYRYRAQGDFKIGESFDINLPTTDVVIDLVKAMPLKAAGEVFDSYYMQSDPPKYKVWFDAKVGKIPLRINGAVGINAAVLTMSSYHEGENL